MGPMPRPPGAPIARQETPARGREVGRTPDKIYQDYVSRWFGTGVLPPPSCPRPGLSLIRVRCAECGQVGHFVSDSARCSNLQRLKALRGKSTYVLGLHPYAWNPPQAGSSSGSQGGGAPEEDRLRKRCRRML